MREAAQRTESIERELEVTRAKALRLDLYKTELGVCLPELNISRESRFIIFFRELLLLRYLLSARIARFSFLPLYEIFLTIYIC